MTPDLDLWLRPWPLVKPRLGLSRNGQVKELSLGESVVWTYPQKSPIFPSPSPALFLLGPCLAILSTTIFKKDT